LPTTHLARNSPKTAATLQHLRPRSRLIAGREASPRVIEGRLILWAPRRRRGRSSRSLRRTRSPPLSAQPQRPRLRGPDGGSLAVMSMNIRKASKVVPYLRHAFVTLLVLSASCAHIPTKFYKEGVTQEQFNTDRLDCHEEALGEAQHTDNPTVQAKVYSECMQKRGYKPVEE